MHIELLIIDPQIDFCDPLRGTLYVAGAEHDVMRLARMVRRIGSQLTNIHVTLDSHHLMDIAHPLFWRDEAGQPPAPFTVITASAVLAGHWTTAHSEMQQRALEYVQQLERNGRYRLCIWPPHCLIGSIGHAVMPSLFDALTNWEEGFGTVDYITKGSNPYTEHYSAIRAEVPDPTDPTTQINTHLLDSLRQADLVAIAGEAGSHCVANTVRDIASSSGDDTIVSKIVLLRDAVSPVGGFEDLQDDMLQEMTALGMKTATTADFLA